jgi:uncharacterized protein YcaQ
MSQHRPVTRETLRRLAITKQHLHRHTQADMLTVIRELGAVQLDPISTVAPSHQLVLWSRLGRYNESELDRLRWQQKALFEYWAHAASIVLTDEYPVHLWNMRREGVPSWIAPEAFEPLREAVLNELRRRGALLSREIDDPTDRYDSVWWSGRNVPRVLEHLWTRGEVVVAGRVGRQRQWALRDDWLPAHTPRDVWDDDAVTRYAAQRAIRALGIATPKHINYHYTRGRYPKLNSILKTLSAEGVLEQVDVLKGQEKLSGQWYLHADDVPLLERIKSGGWEPRTVLLSPFDNLICDRDRTELLFDFRYRVEIYVPANKREYGYYVLPILHGDQLVGRTDLQHDRKTQTFYVKAVYREDNAPNNAPMLGKIRRSITDLAAFVGAQHIEWGNIPDKWHKLR